MEAPCLCTAEVHQRISEAALSLLSTAEYPINFMFLNTHQRTNDKNGCLAIHFIVLRANKHLVYETFGI